MVQGIYMPRGQRQRWCQLWTHMPHNGVSFDEYFLNLSSQSELSQSAHVTFACMWAVFFWVCMCSICRHIEIVLHPHLF